MTKLQFAKRALKMAERMLQACYENDAPLREIKAASDRVAHFQNRVESC